MIELIGYCGGNEYEIRYDGKVAGVFRLYEDPDFSYDGIKLTRFLGYIIRARI